VGEEEEEEGKKKKSNNSSILFFLSFVHTKNQNQTSEGQNTLLLQLGVVNLLPLYAWKAEEKREEEKREEREELVNNQRAVFGFW